MRSGDSIAAGRKRAIGAAFLVTCVASSGCDLIGGIESPELVVDASGGASEGAAGDALPADSTALDQAQAGDSTAADQNPSSGASEGSALDQASASDSGALDTGADGDATVPVEAAGGDAATDADALAFGADGAGADGAAEGGAADAAVDAVVEAEAGPGTTLQCAWAAPNPTLIVDLSTITPDGGSPFFQNDPNLRFRRSTDNTAWLAMQQNNDATGFTLYGFDTQHFTVNAFRQTYPSGSNGFVATVVPTSGGLAVAGPLYGMSASVPVLVYDVPGQYSGAALTPYSIAQLPNPSDLQLSLFEMAPGDYFYYATYASGTTYPFVVGRGTQAGGPGVQSTFATNTSQPNGGAQLVHDAPNMYAVQQGSPGQSGAQVYQLPDSAQVTGTVAPTPVTAPGFSPLLLGAPQQDPSVAGNVDLAFADIDTDGGLSLDLFLGDVAKSSLSQLVVQSPAFVAGPVFNAATAPVGAITWFQDEISSTAYVALAGVPLSQTGINFYWVDVSGRIVASASGPNRLLSTDGNIKKLAIVDTGAIGGVEGTFLIAWTEQPIGDAGRYEQLFINELDCR